MHQHTVRILWGMGSGQVHHIVTWYGVHKILTCPLKVCILKATYLQFECIQTLATIVHMYNKIVI